MRDELEGEGPGYVAGALLGGAVLAFLGAFTGCCCFFVWPLGGVLGAWMAARRADWFGLQEGVVAGACAGAVGWLGQAVISIPMQLVARRFIQANPSVLDAVPPMYREAVREAYMQQPGMAELAVMHGMVLFLYVGAAAFGGALAGQLFLRKEPPG